MFSPAFSSKDKRLIAHGSEIIAFETENKLPRGRYN